MNGAKGLTNSPNVKKNNLENKLESYSENLEYYDISISRLVKIMEKLRGGCIACKDSDDRVEPCGHLKTLSDLNDKFIDSNMELRNLINELEELI